MTKTEREQLLLLKQETVFMNEKIDKNHWEVMTAIEKVNLALAWLPKVFSTKEQHNYNSERLSKIEGIISKIVWMLVTAVFGICWTAIFVVISLFWDKF